MIYKAEGCETREEFDEKASPKSYHADEALTLAQYGDDIFIEDIETYDKSCRRYDECDG